MKLVALILSFAILISSGCAEERTLTKEQVKEIAALVVKREYKTDDPIMDPMFDSKTGIWSCMSSNSFVHGEVFVQIRDKDRHYRAFTYSSAGRKNEFRLRTSLRRRIAKIAPIKVGG